MSTNILDILQEKIDNKPKAKIPTSTEQVKAGYQHNQELRDSIRGKIPTIETEVDANAPASSSSTTGSRLSEARKNFNYKSNLTNSATDHGNNAPISLPTVNKPTLSGRNLNEADLAANVGAGGVHGATKAVKGVAYSPSTYAASQAVSAQKDLNTLKNKGFNTNNSAKATSVTHGSNNPTVSFTPVNTNTLQATVETKTNEAEQAAQKVDEAIRKFENTTVGSAVKKAETWADRVVEENQELNKPSQMVASAAHEIGRMLVQRGVTRAVGGLTAGMEIANAATAASSLGVMYNQVYAENFDNARSQGADVLTAYKYGANQACLEVGTEILGGQPGLYDGVLDKALSKLGTSMADAGAKVLASTVGPEVAGKASAKALAAGTGKLFSGIGQFMSGGTTAGKIFNDVIGEASEEMISTWLEPYITHATLNHGQGEVEKAQAEDYLESAVVSAIISLFYQGTSYARTRVSDGISSKRTGLVYDSPVLTEEGWQSRVNSDATLKKYEGLSVDEIKALNLDKSTRRNANLEGKLIKATLLSDAQEEALSEYQANLEAAKAEQAKAEPQSEQAVSLAAYVQMMDTLINGLGTTVDVNGTTMEVKLPPQFWPAQQIPSWTPNMTAEDVARIQQDYIVPAAQEYGYYLMDNAFTNSGTLRNAVNRNFPRVEITPNLILDSAASEQSAKVELANNINRELAKEGLTQEAWDALLSGKVDGMELAIQSTINGTAAGFYGENVASSLNTIVEARSTGNILGTIPVFDVMTESLKGYYDFNRFRTELAGGLSESEAAKLFAFLKTQNRALEAQKIIKDTASMLEGSGVTVAEMTSDEMSKHPNNVSSFDTKTGTLYLNPNAITNRSAAAISVSHELVHYFFTTGAGEQITNYVNDMMKKTGLKYNDWADRLKGNTEYAGSTDAEIQEEVDARFISIMMSSQELINQFGKEVPDTARELADAVSTIADASVKQGETVAENTVAVEQKQIAAELRSAANGTLVEKETESAQQAGKTPKVEDTKVTSLTRTWSEWVPMKSSKAAYKGAMMRLDTNGDQLEIKIPPNSKPRKKAIRRGGQGSKDAAIVFYDGEVDADGWTHYYSVNNDKVKVSGRELWDTYGGGNIDAATLTTVQETVAQKAKATAKEQKVVKEEAIEKEKENNPIPSKAEMNLENAIPSTPDGAPEKGAVEVAESPIPTKAEMTEKKLPEGFEKDTSKEKKVKKPRVPNGRVTKEAVINAATAVDAAKKLAGYRVVYDRDNNEIRLRFPSGIKSFSDEFKTGALPELGFKPIKFMKEFEVVDEKTGEKKTVKRLVNSTTWHCTDNIKETYKALTGSELTQELIDKAQRTESWNASMTAKEAEMLDQLTEDITDTKGIPFPGMPTLSLHLGGNHTSHKGKIYSSIEARTSNPSYTRDEITFLTANGFTPVTREFFDSNGKLTKARVFQHFMDTNILYAAQSGNADLFAITENTARRPVLAEYTFAGDPGVTWSFYDGEMILNPKRGTKLWNALVNTDFSANSLGNYMKPYGQFFRFDSNLGFKCLHAPFSTALASYAGGISDVSTLLLNNKVAETSKYVKAQNGWVSSDANPDYMFRVLGKGDNRFVLAQDRDTGEYIRPKKGMSFEAQWKSAFGEELSEPQYYDETSHVETKEVSLADYGYGQTGNNTFLVERDNGIELVKTGDLLGLRKGRLDSASFWSAKDDSVIPAKNWKDWGTNPNAKFEVDMNSMRKGQMFFDDYVRDPSVISITNSNGVKLFERGADYSFGKSTPGTIRVQFDGVNGSVIYPDILFSELVNGAFGPTDVTKIVNYNGRTVFDRRKFDALNLSEAQLNRLYNKGKITLKNTDGKDVVYNLEGLLDIRLLNDSAKRYTKEIEEWIKPKENRQPNKMNTGVFNAEGVGSGGERSAKSEIGRKTGTVMSSLDNERAAYDDMLAINYAEDEASEEEQQAGLGALKENKEKYSSPKLIKIKGEYSDLNQVSGSYVYDSNEIKLSADKPLTEILESNTLAMLSDLGFTLDGNTALAKYNSEIWERTLGFEPILGNFAASMQKAFDEQQEKSGGRSRIIPIKAGVTNLESETAMEKQMRETLAMLPPITLDAAPNKLRNRINVEAPAYFIELDQKGVGAYVNYGDNTMRLVVYGDDNSKVDLTTILSEDTVSMLRNLGFKFDETEAYAPYNKEVWKTYLMLPDVGGAEQETFTRTYNYRDAESVKAAGVSAETVKGIEDIISPNTAPKAKDFTPAKSTGKKSADYKAPSALEEAFSPKVDAATEIDMTDIYARDNFTKKIKLPLRELSRVNREAYRQLNDELNLMSAEEIAALDSKVQADVSVKDLAALAKELGKNTSSTTSDVVTDSLGQTVPETVVKKLENSRATTTDGRPQRYVTESSLVPQNRKAIGLVGTAYVLTEATGEEVTGTTGYLNLTNPLRVGSDRATTLFAGDYEDFLTICAKVAAKYGGEQVDRAGMDMYYYGTLTKDSAELKSKLDAQEAEGKLTPQAKAFLSSSIQRKNAHTVLADVIGQYADAAGLTDASNSGAFFQDVITELGYDGVITDGRAFIYTPKRFISGDGSKAYSFDAGAVDAEALVKQYMQARASAPSATQTTPLEQTNTQVGRNSVARMALTPNQEKGARRRSITKFVRSDESTFTEDLKKRTDAAISDGVGMYSPETDKAAREYVAEKMVHGLIDSYSQWAGRLEDDTLFNIKTAKKDAAWTWALVDGFAREYEKMSKAGATAEELAPYYEAFSTTSAVHAMMLTTAGQVEQSATMIQRLDASSTVEFAKRWLEQKDKEFSESRSYRKKGNHLQLTDAQKQALLNAGLNAEERSKVLVDIANSAAKAAPRSAWKAINAMRYTAMLCSPVTWVRNIGGNIVQGFNTRLKNDMAGLMSDIFMEKGKADTTLFRGVDKKGIADFAKNYAEQPAVVMLLRGGGGKYAKSISKGLISSELDLAYDNAHTDMLLRKGPAALLEKGTSAVLEGCDVVALKKNFKHAFRMYANAKGYTAEFLNNPINQKTLDEVRDFAVKQAKDATFRGDTKVGKALTQLKVSHPVAQIVLGGYIPFVNVPINVGKAAVKYSPLSFANACVDAAKAATNRQEATANLNALFDDVASGLIGSGLWLLGYALAKNGAFGIKLHTIDDDEEKDKYDQSLGIQHYSILLRDGSTYTMDWLTPVSMGIFAGAEAFNMESEMSDATGEDLEDYTKADYFVDISTRMLDPLMEMSFMSSITDAVEDFSYVDSGTDFVSLVAGNFGNQLIPTAISKGRTLLGDTQVRSTVAPSDSDFSTETLINDLTGKDVDLGQLNKHWGASGERQYRQALNKLGTGLASHNADAYDYWGNPKQSADSSFERIAESLFSPGYYSSNKATALDKNVLELYEETGGNSDALPQVPSKYATFSDGKHVFTNKEYGEISRTSGQKSAKALKEAYASPLWDGLTNAQKLSVTGTVEKYGMLVAESDYAYRKNTKLSSSNQSALDKVNEARATGLSVGEYYILKELISEDVLTPKKDKNGKNLWKEVKIKTLQSYGLSDEQVMVVAGYDNLKY